MRQYREELKGLPIGSTLSVKHNPCPASGNKSDHKKRLRFTRINKGTCLYYCHHCGKKGRYKIRGGADRPSETVRGPTGYFPTGHSVYAMFPQKCQDWLSKAYVTDCYRKGIVWSDKQERLILPCRGRDGTTLGYQARGFGKEPKYITKGFGRVLYHWSPGGSGKEIVIVEDILSAMRIGEAGYTGVALLRTTIQKALLLEVLNAEPERVIVWLDNDNPTVRRLARRLVHTLEGYGIDTGRVSNRIDPKYYSPDELKEILKETIE